METPKKKITDFSTSWFQLMDEGYFDTGCAEAQPRVLHEIYMNSGCTATAISKKLNINKSYIGKIIKECEKQKLIFRQQSTEDKRNFHLFLTDKGTTHIEQYMKLASDSVAKKVQALNEIDKQRLMDAFSTIMNILSR